MRMNIEDEENKKKNKEQREHQTNLQSKLPVFFPTSSCMWVCVCAKLHASRKICAIW